MPRLSGQKCVKCGEHDKRLEEYANEGKKADLCQKCLDEEQKAMGLTVSSPKRRQNRAPSEPKPPKECQCGCGGMTKGGKFLPGHDAKLKGRLLKASKEGDNEATNELKVRGWWKV